MRLLVTGSSGNLGEALVRVLRADGCQTVGLDVVASPYTDLIGSVDDRTVVSDAVAGVDAVIHTATLHKPHIPTHDTRAFLETNVAGTATLLEAAAGAGVGAFVFTSTTSAFGWAMSPPAGQPAAWVTEDVVPVPKNVCGVTKVAAEDLCQLVHQERGLACVVLRMARFFPGESDDRATPARIEPENARVNELLHRRVDLADAVDACRLAVRWAPEIGFRRYIVSATTPFSPADLVELAVDAPSVVRRLFPDFEDLYARRGWGMFPRLDRVYVNDRARDELGWEPVHDFAWALGRLRAGADTRSPLAVAVGRKVHHRPTAPAPIDLPMSSLPRSTDVDTSAS